MSAAGLTTVSPRQRPPTRSSRGRERPRHAAHERARCWTRRVSASMSAIRPRRGQATAAAPVRCAASASRQSGACPQGSAAQFRAPADGTRLERRASDSLAGVRARGGACRAEDILAVRPADRQSSGIEMRRRPASRRVRHCPRPRARFARSSAATGGCAAATRRDDGEEVASPSCRAEEEGKRQARSFGLLPLRAGPPFGARCARKQDAARNRAGRREAGERQPTRRRAAQQRDRLTPLRGRRSRKALDHPRLRSSAAGTKE